MFKGDTLQIIDYDDLSGEQSQPWEIEIDLQNQELEGNVQDVQSVKFKQNTGQTEVRFWIAKYGKPELMKKYAIENAFVP